MNFKMLDETKGKLVAPENSSVNVLRCNASITTEHEDFVEIYFDIKNIYNFILDKKINAH